MKKGSSFDSAIKGMELPGSVFSSLRDYASATDAASMSAEDFKQKNSDAMNSVSSGASSLGSATTAVSGFSKALSLVGSALSELAIDFAIGAAITIAIKAFDALIVTANEANEAMNSAFSDYDDAKANLEGINSEIESTNARIDELESKGSLTFVEQEELEKLKSATRELQIQQDLAEKQEGKAAKKAGDSVVDAFEKNYGKQDVSEKTIENYQKEIQDYVDENGFIHPDFYSSDDINYQIASLRELKKERDELLKQDVDSMDEFELEDFQQKVEGYSNQIDSLTAGLEDDADALMDYKSKLESIPDGFSTDEQREKLKEISDLFNTVYKETSPEKWAEYTADEILSRPMFDGVKDQLEDLAGSSDLTVDRLKSDYSDLANALTDAGISLEDFVSNINASVNPALNNSSDAVEQLQSTFSAFNSQAVGWINSMDSINAALANSVSGKGLSYSIDEESGEIIGDVRNLMAAYQDLEGYDAATLFERTANGVKVNRDALRALQAQEEAMTKAEFLEERQKLTEQLTQAQIEQSKYKPDSQEYANATAMVDAITQQIQQVELLSAAYDGATSAYQKWIDAQSNGEEGDMYDAIAGTALERGQELYEKGLVGTEEFRAIADLFSNQDLSTASVDEIVSAYESALPIIQTFFTEGQEGAQAFADKMVELGEATRDAEGNYKFDAIDTNDLADRLGIDVEAIESIFYKLRDYGFDIQFTGNTEDLDEIKQKATEAQEALKAMQTESSVDISAAVNFNIDDLDTQDELQSKINELNELKATPGIDASQLQQLNTLIDTCQQKMNVLDGESITPEVTLDGVQSAYSAAGQLISRIQEIQTINAEKHLSISVDGDDQVQALAEQLASMPAEIKTSIGIEGDADASAIIQQMQDNPGSIQIPVEYVPQNTTADNTSIPDTKTVTVNVQGQEKIDALKSAINGITDKTVNINVSSAPTTGTDALKASIDNVKSKNVTVEAKVTGTNLVNALSAAIARVKSKSVSVSATTSGTAAVQSLGSAINNVRSKTVTVTTNNVTNNITNNGTKVDGTAHYLGTAPKIKGTAFANGNWGLKRYENALTGELGQELVVRNGRFFTVGDNGPEFVRLKPGDIVFNHLQTKALLERGYVTSRGKLIGGGSSYAEGSAHVEGPAHATVSGGGRFNPGGSGSKANSSSTSNNSTQKAASSAASAANSAAKAAESAADSADAAKEAVEKLKEGFDALQDWPQTWQDRWDRYIQKNEQYSSDSVDNLYNKQNVFLDTAIKAMADALPVLNQLKDTYMRQADASGLSEDYKLKIQVGTLDIESITDEELKARIDEYQKWYERALEMQDKADDYMNDIIEYSTQKLENIVDDFDKQEAYLQALLERNENYQDWFTGKGWTEDVSTLKGSIEYTKQLQELLTDKWVALKSEFDSLVASGSIKEYTDEWWEWNTTLQEIHNSIIETNISLDEMKHTIQQVRFDRFEKALDQFDALTDDVDTINSLISDSGLFNDDATIRTNGLVKAGLASINLVTARKQVQVYNNAIEALKRDLEQGMLTQEQYNEALADFKSRQNDAIQAVYAARQAILDIVRDGINAETEAYNKLIAAKKEALSDEYEAHNRQKQIKEYQDNITRIQSQINAMQYDNTAETVAKRKKLEEELRKAQEELDEYYYEQSYNDQQDALDDAQESFEEAQDDRLDELETNLDAQNAAIEEYLGKVKDEHKAVYDELVKLAEQYGIELTDELLKPWESAEDALNHYLESIGKGGEGLTGGVWKEDEKGWRYEKNDGSFATGTQTIDGKKYQFDDSGYMQTGWQKDDNGKWNYFDKTSGAALTNQWVTDDEYGRKYYVKSDGTMADNEIVEINGKKYFFQKDGPLGINKWIDSGGNWYRTDAEGQVLTGWYKDGWKWYYLNPDGKMVSSDWVDYKGNRYFLQKDGAMAFNTYVWDPDEGVYHWVNADGAMVPGRDVKTPPPGSNVVKYAKGTKHSRGGIALVDEEGIGSEVILDPKYGRLTKLSQDSHVYSKTASNNLWDMANNPSKFIERFSPDSGAVTQNLSMNFNAPLVNVQGNADSNTVAQLQNIATDIAETVAQRAIKDTFRRIMPNRTYR